jgi:hypothetical protein
VSIVVPTVKGPESWGRTVRTLDVQARNGNAEIVLATACAVDVRDVGPSIRLVHVPGANVFELRARALEAARGNVVAVLEDHIVVGDNWCKRVIASFERHPEADAVIGGVTNGAPGCLNRAGFLITWGPFLAPLDHVPLHRCPPPGIIAFRAAVLPQTEPEPGFLEYELPTRLRAAGRMVADPEIRVEHVQFVGLRSFALQFHSGVSFGGLDNLSVAARPRRERLRELRRLPRLLLEQTHAGLVRVGARETVPCRVAITLMVMANALGQVAGIVRGSVGHSPAHLE